METGSVLVVDDDPKILELVRAYLQRAGYAVVTAVDGEDALRKIEAHRPNLVVLDVMLPQVDGLVLARHLRDERNNLPILMMSARGTVSDRITGLVEGAGRPAHRGLASRRPADRPRETRSPMRWAHRRVE